MTYIKQTLLKDTSHAKSIKNIILDCLGWTSGYSQAITIIDKYNIDKKRHDDNKHIIDKYEKILFFMDYATYTDNKTLKKQLIALLKMFGVTDFIIKEELKIIKNMVF